MGSRTFPPGESFFFLHFPQNVKLQNNKKNTYNNDVFAYSLALFFFIKRFHPNTRSNILNNNNDNNNSNADGHDDEDDAKLVENIYLFFIYYFIIYFRNGGDVCVYICSCLSNGRCTFLHLFRPLLRGIYQLQYRRGLCQ